MVKVDVRTGAIVKNSGIFSVGGARSKTAFFRVLGYSSTILRTAYRKQFYPKTMESRDSEGVPFASLESL